MDCYLYIDNGKITTRLYDKRDDFNFPIVNFPILNSNIPSAQAYGVYVSQLIRYARICSNYQDFMERGKVLTTNLLSQGYQKTKLVATLKKKGKRKVQGVPQLQTAAIPRPQEEEETDNSKQAQTEQTY